MNIRKSSNQKDLEVPLLEKGDVEKGAGKSPKKVVDDDEDENIDANECSIFNKTYCCGIIAGLLMQSLSLYANGTIAALSKNGLAALAASPQRIVKPDNVPNAIFAIAQYWELVAMFLPPLVTIVVQRYRMKKTKRGAAFASAIRSNMESFVECARFQLGVFMGSLCTMGLINLILVTKHAPTSLLLTFYAACILASFFAICVFQTCLNHTCAYVSSVEINIHFDKDEEARE